LDQTLITIVDFIMSTRKEPPPDAVLDRCREILVDTLGCAIGGRNCIGAQVARAFPASPDGEVGMVIGSARDASIDIAAFWNTAMIRYLDFSDLLGNGHPSDMIGGLVAMSRTAKASGADILIAVAIAYEIYYRLAEIVLSQEPWTIDQGYCIAIGTTGGICHLLGLSREETTHAISFAAANGAPLRVSRAGELSHYKGVATAVSTRHAVFCVHMARSGMTAPSAPFDGRHGIVELMRGKEGPLNLPAFDTWNLLKTRLKYFPVAYNTQIGIWAALELRKQVDYTRIEKITLYTSMFLKHESGSEPAKWDPRNRETADHSLPYIFSRALQDGTVNINTFDLEKVLDPEIRTLMNKVTVEGDAVMGGSEFPDIVQARLNAVDRDGKTYQVHVRDPLGHYLNPFTVEEIENKFKLLTEPALGRDRAAAAFDLVWRTKEAESFVSVLDALVPERAGS
jgi:2-methylcitrate dehydratase